MFIIPGSAEFEMDTLLKRIEFDFIYKINFSYSLFSKFVLNQCY